MKKKMRWMWLAGCLLVLAGGSRVSGQELSTIAVMDFESIGVEEYLGQAVAENLRTSLINTGAFQVVERARLRKVLQEQQLQLSGMIDRESAVKVGQLLGANIFLLGSVTRMGLMYTINVRFIDVETALSIGAKKVTGKSESELPRMIDQVVDALMGKEIEEPIVERRKPVVERRRPAVPEARPTAPQQLQLMYPRKSPVISCLLSWFILPGSGHMYNGQWGKGIVYLGLTIGEIVVMVATMPYEEPGYWEAGYYEWNEETWEYEWVAGQWVEGEEHGNAEVCALSAIALVITRLVDIIDAPISAGKINRKHGWIGSIEIKPDVSRDYAGLKLIQRF